MVTLQLVNGECCVGGFCGAEDVKDGSGVADEVGLLGQEC